MCYLKCSTLFKSDSKVYSFPLYIYIVTAKQLYTLMLFIQTFTK